MVVILHTFAFSPANKQERNAQVSAFRLSLSPLLSLSLYPILFMAHIGAKQVRVRTRLISSALRRSSDDETTIGTRTIRECENDGSAHRYTRTSTRARTQLYTFRSLMSAR